MCVLNLRTGNVPAGEVATGMVGFLQDRSCAPVGKLERAAASDVE
jgi:hypothetical protein